MMELNEDLYQGLFHDCILRAYEDHCYEITSMHPKTALGHFMYHGVTGNLRTVLCSRKGWYCCDEQNVARVVYKKTGLSIICSSGDENTGIETAMPSTQSAKGKATSQLVGQLMMDFDNFEKPYKEDENQKIWYLLYCLDRNNREIRCELSRPLLSIEKRKITSWTRRIILDPISLTSGTVSDALLHEASEKVDVQVSLKRAI